MQYLCITQSSHGALHGAPCNARATLVQRCVKSCHRDTFRATRDTVTRNISAACHDFTQRCTVQRCTKHTVHARRRHNNVNATVNTVRPTVDKIGYTTLMSLLMQLILHSRVLKLSMDGPLRTVVKIGYATVRAGWRRMKSSTASNVLFRAELRLILSTARELAAASSPSLASVMPVAASQSSIFWMGDRRVIRYLRLLCHVNCQHNIARFSVARKRKVRFKRAATPR